MEHRFCLEQMLLVKQLTWRLLLEEPMYFSGLSLLSMQQTGRQLLTCHLLLLC